MARITKVVKVELTDKEMKILCEASKILDELAEEDGADELHEIMDNFDSGIYYFSHALDNLVDNSK